MRSTYFAVILTVFAGSMLFVSGSQPAHAQQASEESVQSGYFEHDNYEAALKWLRGFENPDSLPNYEQIRYEGIQQLRAMPNPLIGQAALKANANVAWQPAGISQTGTVSGRLANIGFDSSGGIYVCSPNGGLWKSNDNGATWKSLSDSWPVLATSAVAIDPKNQSTIYAATGEAFGGLDQNSQSNGQVSGFGIWKSIDGGLNWTNVGKNLGSYFNAILINPINTNIVYVAAASSILRSTDAGITWATAVSLNGNLPSLVMDPVNPAVLYAAAGSQLMKSTDSGATWYKPALVNFPSASNGGLMVLGMTPANHLYLYVSSGIALNGVAGGKIGLSRDSGAHWETTLLDTGASNYLAGQGWYANALAVSPVNPDYVLFGGLDVYYSNQNGASPQKVSNSNGNAGQTNYTHADIHVITYHNGTAFTLSDGGIYYSAPTENGQAWHSDMNSNLGTFQQVGGDAYATKSKGEIQFFIAGAQDNGTTKWTPGNMIGPLIQGGDGGRCFIDQQNGQIIYASYPDFTGQAVIYKSTTGGAGFSPNVLSSSAIQNDRQSGYMFYDVCEADPNVVVMCGRSKVWLTTDGFSNSPTDILSITTSTKVGAPAFAHVAKLDPSYIYVGNVSSYVYWTSDQGTTWAKMTSPTTALNGRPTWITTDPGDPTMVYLTTSNATGKPLWTSQDNGQTWTQPTQTGLPTGLYRAVAVDAQGDIFMGHDGGIVAMDHRDSTWVPLITGLPQGVMVTALQVRGHYLVATTYGRGMFFIDLKPLFGQSSVATAGQPSPVSIESVYPNPVTTGASISKIRYSLANESLAHVAVYDNLGREERVLVNEYTTSGEHEKQIDLAGLPAGRHYILLSAGGVSVTKPITIE
ncbi:MAG: T9SS type A sorting domain-containing protein [Bacteroidota bacterium]|nr:T9SS type A sorting domain-containing protein [Bacteroidota bacterium]MDP4232275.1 T9SS type A sorting domain-containing protein [Bacteroidota bacterium]MDP4241414.1 T9SS type A sorting domain-containing protein [Bacteroidota bacterium]MDP4286762.1 T9SS type A sorting domain-containing protein [Bacteroidota bacterium]